MKQLRYLPALALLAACGVGEMDVTKFIPAEADRSARGVIAMVADGPVDSVMMRLDPELPADSARAMFARLHILLAGASLDSLVPIGAQSSTISMNGAETTTRHLTYQLHHGGQWFWLSPWLRETGTSTLVVGFHYQTWTLDPIAASAFIFEGKGVGHYLFLLAMALCAAVSIVSAVWVARQRGFPRRWGWAVVALVGVGVVSLDWRSGQFGQNLVSANLFCFGAVKLGPAAPWMLSFAFPAGAVLAISRVRAWRGKKVVPPVAGPPEVRTG